ncbi:tetratricopeptide repeat protein, partial [bacterium]|nr:tetratricopeptide repeat protein [bacterium]
YSTYIYQGLSYQDRQDYTKAIEAFMQAIEVNPIYTNAYILMTDILLQQDKRDGAISILNKALKTVKHTSKIYAQLANIFATEKNIKEVIKNYREALRANPNFAEYKLQFVDALEEYLKG